MRAIFQLVDENIEIGSALIVNKENFHHLVNVVRIKLGENILVLNGNGLKVLTRVDQISKREISLLVEKIDLFEMEEQKLDIFIGHIKKDAFEQIIKMSVEMGIRKIYFFKSEFSQNKQILSKERLNSLIESSIIQSNNPFYLQLNDQLDFKSINFGEYSRIYYFSPSQEFTNANIKNEVEGSKKREMIIIGPEGGMSLKEEEFLSKLENISFVKFPTCILKTVTAFPMALGYYFGQKK